MKSISTTLESWQQDDAARLRALLAAREPKLSQADFGAQFGLGSQGMVWQYVAGRRPLNIKAATAFARGLGVPVDAFSPTIALQIAEASRSVHGVDMPDARSITDDDDLAPPTLAIELVSLHLQAGIDGIETVPLFEDNSQHHVPRQWLEENDLSPRALLAIRIKGNSMQPLMYEGDIAVINTRDKARKSGGVFAMNYNGQAVIKRLLYERREWFLASDNPAFRPEPCKGAECIVIGRIVRFDPRNFKDRL
ncbi:MAG: LexA family transcriptional regulator [Duganella sp.]